MDRIGRIFIESTQAGLNQMQPVFNQILFVLYILFEFTLSLRVCGGSFLRILFFVLCDLDLCAVGQSVVAFDDDRFAAHKTLDYLYLAA